MDTDRDDDPRWLGSSPGASVLLTMLVPGLMNKRWLVSMTLDLVLLCVAFIGAHLLRFDGQIPDPMVVAVAEALPIVPSELNGAESRIRDACDRAGIPVRRMGRLIE